MKGTKPNQCYLIGSNDYKKCETCSLCPEVNNYKSPPHSYGWKWCPTWLEVNPQDMNKN